MSDKDQGAPPARKATPGPWIIKDGGYAFTFVIEGADGSPVADASDVPNSKANAKLIAAAPTLADALEAMMVAAETHRARDQAYAALRAAGRLP